MPMPGMKVTLDAAMRARDVSRPHAEHEAVAEAGEPAPARAPEHGQGAPPRAASDTGTLGAGTGGAPKGRSSRRRRRRR
jgi:hypothetical protein